MDSDNVTHASATGNEPGRVSPAAHAVQLARVSRLLVVAPSWLGDAVMALPALADLRRAAPRAALLVAARPTIAPLFSMVPGVDSVIALDARRRTSRDVEALRRTRADAVLLLPNSWRTAMVAWRAGIPQRWGYRTSMRGPLLTVSLPPPGEVHQAVYYQHLTAALGAPKGLLEPRLVVTEAARHSAAEYLAAAGWDGTRPLVAIAPGAAYGTAKRWPAASFAGLASRLASDGILPVFLGGPADRDAGREVAERLPPATPFADLTGRTDLQALAGVLQASRALVSNDSGAMHVAAALGVPVTAFFGPTDEEATHPLGTGPHEILTHRVWCRPCMLRDCPLDHRCMTRIGVDRAFEAVAHQMTK